MSRPKAGLFDASYNKWALRYTLFALVAGAGFEPACMDYETIE